MKRALFDILQTKLATRIPMALVTDLTSGRQALRDRDGTVGDLDLSTSDMEMIDEAIRTNRSGMNEIEASGNARRLFVRTFNPPLRLLIVGAVHIAQALAPIATVAGYEVTIIDPRRAWATTERFPGTPLILDWPDKALARLEPDHRSAIAVLSHDPKLDDAALAVALRSEAFYIGALGSRKSHNARLERLTEAGFDQKDLTRIHAPIGLDLGGRAPSEIAVSVIAEMTQALYRRDTNTMET